MEWRKLGWLEGLGLKARKTQEPARGMEKLSENTFTEVWGLGLQSRALPWAGYVPPALFNTGSPIYWQC